MKFHTREGGDEEEMEGIGKVWTQENAEKRWNCATCER